MGAPPPAGEMHQVSEQRLWGPLRQGQRVPRKLLLARVGERGVAVCLRLAVSLGRTPAAQGSSLIPAQGTGDMSISWYLGKTPIPKGDRCCFPSPRAAWGAFAHSPGGSSANRRRLWGSFHPALRLCLLPGWTRPKPWKLPCHQEEGPG